MGPEWKRFINWLGTANPKTAGLPVCPFIKRLKWVFAGDDVAQVVFTTDPLTCQAMRCRMTLLNEAIRPLGWMAVAMHPDDPFDGNGLHSRRAPQASVTMTRLGVGIDTKEELEPTGYYDGWTEENHNDFPGCEDLP